LATQRRQKRFFVTKVIPVYFCQATAQESIAALQVPRILVHPMFKFYSIIACIYCLSVPEMNGQTIIVRGKPSNGILTWDDFTGNPVKQSPFSAQTTTRFYTNIRSPKMYGDTVRFRHIEVIVELDSVLSWSRPKERTENLLIHEQTHFDIAIICAKAYLRRLNETIFTRSTVDSLLNQIHDQSMNEYRAMQKRYDEQTRNGKDKQKQQQWNTWVAVKLLEE
jgi:hypothetical protein